MRIKAFFDENTATFSYVVSDPATQGSAIIDSVLDYNPETGHASTTTADKIIEYIETSKLSVEWILETHIHADHLTAAHYLKEKLGGQLGIGERISEVLKFWVPLFNTQHDTPLDGTQFDRLFKNKDEFNIGTLKVKVMHTPGHTPACVGYYINDEAIFVGDTLFMPYLGTSRADFPGGSAQKLYQSIQAILNLDDQTRIFICHDYPPEGQQPNYETTVLEQKKNNMMINETISENDYIQRRTTRDQTLPPPRLLLPSIQINLRAGDFGVKESNGTQYIKIPINKL